METTALQYKTRNKNARLLTTSQSIGWAIRKKSGLEEALEDVDNGRVTTIHTPKTGKFNESRSE
jgi:hypothetical protein